MSLWLRSVTGCRVSDSSHQSLHLFFVAVHDVLRTHAWSSTRAFSANTACCSSNVLPSPFALFPCASCTSLPALLASVHVLAGIICESSASLLYVMHLRLLLKRSTPIRLLRMHAACRPSVAVLVRVLRDAAAHAARTVQRLPQLKRTHPMHLSRLLAFSWALCHRAHDSCCTGTAQREFAFPLVCVCFFFVQAYFQVSARFCSAAHASALRFIGTAHCCAFFAATCAAVSGTHRQLVTPASSAVLIRLGCPDPSRLEQQLTDGFRCVVCNRAAWRPLRWRC
jgi:hypothetical protein